LYGGTAGYVSKELPKSGVDVDFIDASQPSDWALKIKPNTKVIYIESITNPLMTIPELDEIVRFAKENNLISIVDNTFATPVLYNPIVNGFDIVLHSATKYLNGHSDIVGGAIMGGEEHIYKIKSKLNYLGGSMDPNTCYLLQRGIKTLLLRFNKQSENAKKIAEYLNNHENVIKVNYPGIPSNSEHLRAKKYFGGYGAMLSFELKGGVDYSDEFIGRLKYPLNAASLGGVESLITRPVQTSHSFLNPEERAKAGISDSLIRYSPGIESAADLIDDMDHAF
jgi:cystathionine gamma-synthase/cystathionine gamma-lyase/cystathionine beta-lyase